MSLPQNTENLVQEINALLDRDESNKADWIEIKLELCRLLYATRKEFTDNKAFGKWFDKHLGASIGVNERAAFIAMGADLGHAREVFEKTDRKSIQLIYEKEFKDQPKIGRGHNSGAGSTSHRAKAGTGATAGAAAPRKPVFTLKEFRQLQKVLHSDRKEAITVAEMDKALALLMAHEAELVGTEAEKKAAKAKEKAENGKSQPQPATAGVDEYATVREEMYGKRSQG
jgi:hypothetical protein